jgi:hypothetical protein
VWASVGGLPLVVYAPWCADGWVGSRSLKVHVLFWTLPIA